MSGDFGLIVHDDLDRTTETATTQHFTQTSNAPAAALLSAAAVDDAFENNDIWYRAANFGTISKSTVLTDLVMADTADWYSFKLAGAAGTDASVGIQFQTARGDLDLAVYDARLRLVGYSNGITNSETVSLATGTPGTYYVVVYGYHGATNPTYSLNINPGQSAHDDRFESNNSFAQAANLGTLTAARTESSLVMADGVDWYRFTMNGSGTGVDYVGINFQHAVGDLDMAVYDASGRRIAVSNGVSNSERVSLAGLSAGTYYVQVYGYRGATNPNYSLIVDPGVIAVTTPTNVPSTTPTTNAATAFQIDTNFYGLTATQQAIVRDATSRWQQIIIGDLPNMVYNGRTVDDLLIDVRASSIDGVGGVLGEAAPDRFRSGSRLPYHGSMQFDSADLAQMERNGSLFDVVLHEIGHVLGIGSIWQYRGLLSGANTSNPLFVGAQATLEYSALVGHATNGVPVENSGGSGTRDSHWRESIFTSELMTGYIGPGVNLSLSRVTVASLADLGYQVNINASDAFQLA